MFYVKLSLPRLILVTLISLANMYYNGPWCFTCRYCNDQRDKQFITSNESSIHYCSCVVNWWWWWQLHRVQTPGRHRSVRWRTSVQFSVRSYTYFNPYLRHCLFQQNSLQVRFNALILHSLMRYVHSRAGTILTVEKN